MAALPRIPAGSDALFDPDAAQDGAVPPAGRYRCRTFRLGGASTAPATAACLVGEDGGFAVEEGRERRSGAIRADTASRAVFLGTVMLADERRPMPYGRDARRDAAGLVERVGPRRWRLVLPYPPTGAVLDVVELVPAGG